MHNTTIASYALPDGSTIARQPRRKGPDGAEAPALWSVTHLGNCLNRNSEWEHEPLPSSRDNDFFDRCRVFSPEEAHSHWARLPENAQYAAAMPQEKPKQAPHYTVVAYRWGCTNDHFYQVGQTADLDCAIDLADDEADGRGGKYGVAVYQWDNDTDHQRVHYAPSAYREDAPQTNPRLSMFQSIGHRAHEAAVTGSVLLASPAGAGSGASDGNALIACPAQIPGWLDQVVRKEEHASRLWTLLQERTRAQKAGGTFTPWKKGDPLVDPQTRVWLDAARIAIDAELDALMSKKISRSLD